jgi:hypothetical protein
MGYSLNRFLRPLKDADKTIRVFDDRNFPVHTINPFSVLRVFVTNSNLSISLSGNRTIVLDFSTHDETKEALAKFQSYVDILRQKSPDVIDKQTEKYIEKIVGISGLSNLNGLTASSQNISTTSDENISLGIQSSGKTHSLSITWTGILPIVRGGLNNTEFSEGELIISKNDKIVSSGISVKDNEVSDTNIWTSKRVNDEFELFIYKEKPIGEVDGLNVNFILNFEPVANSEHVFLNGLLMEEGIDSDYVLSGSSIIFNDAPPANSKLICTYKKIYLIENIIE